MLKTIQITKNSPCLKQVQALYERAFPKDEKAPFEDLLINAFLHRSTFLAFFDQDCFIGLSYIIRQDNLTYLFYLAVEESQRNQGYGGQILEMIQNLYPDDCLFLDIELVDPRASNLLQRKKRKAFYLKHHFISSGYTYHFHHVDYEILTYGQPFEAKKGQKLFYDYSHGFVNFIFQKNTMIQ